MDALPRLICARGQEHLDIILSWLQFGDEIVGMMTHRCTSSVVVLAFHTQTLVECGIARTAFAKEKRGMRQLLKTSISQFWVVIRVMNLEWAQIYTNTLD